MDRVMKRVFWCFAALTMAVVAFMGVYIIANGLPFFKHTNLWAFLTGKNWIPSGEIKLIGKLMPKFHLENIKNIKNT